jgi:hypothetical protein
MITNGIATIINMKLRLSSYYQRRQSETTIRLSMAGYVSCTQLAVQRGSFSEHNLNAESLPSTIHLSSASAYIVY